ncbi:MAG: imidazole glycerol phosphate synthase subunit HisH [Anaerolineae bacterium]|nr:imidazole glycerol phosphate synthase subunit HisH [Anaerolineae bacterium]
MIVIIDLGLGNTGSIINMLKRIGTRAVVSAEADIIAQATKLILPGVGAFDAGMAQLESRGLINQLHHRVMIEKIPVIGLCLGMQLMMKRSEEGIKPGLGWIDGECKRFRFPEGETRYKVPHMGWNEVTACKNSIFFQTDAPPPRFYFVHSYHIIANDRQDVAGVTHYGYEFASVIEHENIRGTQFHPEKSHRYGMKLLEDFIQKA